jgi:hypothetical protein
LATSPHSAESRGDLTLELDWERSDATVHQLMDAGDLEGARAEFAKTLLDSLDSGDALRMFDQRALEGMESGEAVEMTAVSWRELRFELHRRAGIE